MYVCMFVHMLCMYVYTYVMYVWMDGWMDVCVCVGSRPKRTHRLTTNFWLFFIDFGRIDKFTHLRCRGNSHSGVYFELDDADSEFQIYGPDARNIDKHESLPSISMFFSAFFLANAWDNTQKKNFRFFVVYGCVEVYTLVFTKKKTKERVT